MEREQLTLRSKDERQWGKEGRKEAVCGGGERWKEVCLQGFVQRLPAWSAPRSSSEVGPGSPEQEFPMGVSKTWKES